MTFSNVEVSGIEEAIAELPSTYSTEGKTISDIMVDVGKNRKWRRMVLQNVTLDVDVCAPISWWYLFNQIGEGVTYQDKNLVNPSYLQRPISWERFEKVSDLQERDIFECKSDGDAVVEALEIVSKSIWMHLIGWLETLRSRYQKTKNIAYLRELERILPQGFLETKTVTFTYENILSILFGFQDLRGVGWFDDFSSWAETLPYADKLLFYWTNNEEEKEDGPKL